VPCAAPGRVPGGGCRGALACGDLLRSCRCGARCSPALVDLVRRRGRLRTIADAGESRITRSQILLNFQRWVAGPSGAATGARWASASLKRGTWHPGTMVSAFSRSVPTAGYSYFHSCIHRPPKPSKRILVFQQWLLRACPAGPSDRAACRRHGRVVQYRRRPSARSAFAIIDSCFRLVRSARWLYARSRLPEAASAGDLLDGRARSTKPA